MGQVDVTAADAVGQGKIPAVNQQAAVSAQTTGMINTALQHMGLGADPWRAVKVGVRLMLLHTAPAACMLRQTRFPARTLLRCMCSRARGSLA